MAYLVAFIIIVFGTAEETPIRMPDLMTIVVIMIHATEEAPIRVAIFMAVGVVVVDAAEKAWFRMTDLLPVLVIPLTIRVLLPEELDSLFRKLQELGRVSKILHMRFLRPIRQNCVVKS